MTSMRTTLLLASLLAVLAAGCRKREPSKVEIFDETATPAQTERSARWLRCGLPPSGSSSTMVCWSTGCTRTTRRPCTCG